MIILAIGYGTMVDNPFTSSVRVDTGIDPSNSLECLEYICKAKCLSKHLVNEIQVYEEDVLMYEFKM